MPTQAAWDCSCPARCKVNLNTIREVKQPRFADEIVKWSPGYAWLAGGTWLFSTPQIATDTLIDLRSLRWPALAASNTGLDIAATCTIAELYALPTAGGMDRGAAVSAVRPRLSCLVQDLERGHGRRQYLHVAAGRADGDACHGARGPLHAPAPRRGLA